MDLKLSRLWVSLLGLLLIVLTGCASSSRAPVESREPVARPVESGTPAPVTDASPSAAISTVVARPGYHIVKRGETLYSIALEYGQDYRDVAAWNNLDNAAVISVGQELRVLPPPLTTESSGTKLVAPTIEVRPLDSSAPVSAPALPSNVPVKQDPKGGRIAYSPEAWKDLQSPDAKSASSASAPIAAPPTTSASSEPKAAAVAGDDAVDWLWPGNGKMLAGFNETTNKGVDIGGAVGDPVLAAGAGKVVYVGTGLRGYGNLVIIKHNNTYLSAYAHNSEIFVKEGQSVQRGQKIAALGSSDADHPALHFEIRKQGKPVDPLKYLPVR
ncbi:MAG TPA: peptidoglycan DD-metalloendopeptidase family protein [Rhodocyclaceae bacterium]|nr:peptidoglycan DD-metalloendopeptidase family protein [Rhodocyclaceae bacterium]